MDGGAASEEDRSVVPLRSTGAFATPASKLSGDPGFGRAEPTLTDGEAVDEDGAPGSSVVVSVVGEGKARREPGLLRVCCF